MSTQHFSFKFRARNIKATGREADEVHPTVLLLCLNKSLFNTVIWFLLPLLPQWIYIYLKNRWPEWILPEHIVLKLRKSNIEWDTIFEDEIRYYERLAPLQGYRIPEFYGRLQYQGQDAIIISRVFGRRISAFGIDSPFPRGEPELYLYLRDAYEEIGKFGLYHGDHLFANFLLVNDSRGKRIMALDLERMYEFPVSRLAELKPLSGRVKHAIEMDRFGWFPMGVPEEQRWRVL